MQPLVLLQGIACYSIVSLAMSVAHAEQGRGMQPSTKHSRLLTLQETRLL